MAVTAAADGMAAPAPAPARIQGFVPAPTPVAAPLGLPQSTPAPATPTPDVVLQSFYSALSDGAAQAGANNSFFVQSASFAGDNFGLVFLDAPSSTGCAGLPMNASLLPVPALQVCSGLSNRGAGAAQVAAQVHSTDASSADATAISFTNALQANGTASGTVQLTTPDGFAIAFTYSAQPCSNVTLLPSCAL